jgi:hypothetical protein
VAMIKNAVALLHYCVFRESEQGVSVSIVSDYGLDDLGSIPDKRSLSAQPGLGPIQSPVQWAPGFHSPGAKPGRGVNLTSRPPYSAEVKKV